MANGDPEAHAIPERVIQFGACIDKASDIMTTSIKRLAVFLCFTALLAIVSVGCNTAHGFGEDVEKVGDKIQEGTD